MSRSQLDPDEAQSRRVPVEENIRVQQRFWFIEQLGCLLLPAMVLLTLLGVFSNGLLSDTVGASPGNDLQVHYERFLRNGATTSMVIEAHHAGDAPVQITLTGEQFDNTTLESLYPQPLTSESLHDGLSFTVQPDATGHARLYLSLRAEGVGMFRSRVGIAGETVSLRQFIYP